MKIADRMPRRVDLGRHMEVSIEFALYQLEKVRVAPDRINPAGRRTVMGFILPAWQRPLVWSAEQKVAFIESSWRGIPLGTYTFNQDEPGSDLDYLLIDGQQRLTAIEDYIHDRFPVFGLLFSQLTLPERSRWENTKFAAYKCESADENYLRRYYNIMNFAGTPHLPHQRAKAR
ncbi:hypothetical protein GCM10019059_35740 [Camelimonas fluminis]|uniref:DUF262 domain-containing protein n=1 Tax=Camelimonas fluminis TaxID=1576911 RepID=A0ABV7UFF7_9HYPH|nr:DUF262 domain-containing protein [Camelimonas fluminis]GHE72988.1 hypothetical protein GCM10019059_35740 [Camelimonas fluminis]